MNDYISFDIPVIFRMISHVRCSVSVFPAGSAECSPCAPRLSSVPVCLSHLFLLKEHVIRASDPFSDIVNSVSCLDPAVPELNVLGKA